MKNDVEVTMLNGTPKTLIPSNGMLKSSGKP
jgi:hypothetical protein